MKTIFEQLISLAKAATTQVIAGFPTVTDEQLSERAAICDICPSLDKEQYRCNECGCQLKYKLNWATQSCPINKWKEIKNE